MAAPATGDEFLDLVQKSGVVDEKRLDTYAQQMRAAGTMPEEPGRLAGFMVRDGLLTHFQAEQFLLGKWRRFTIGKYKVLERLGSGGMGSVYLCEHKFMRRRVAVKVLPAAKAEDPSSLERFYREARAAAALDHPNIVRAYDIDQDENLHFLVMEYVDGASLQEIIKKNGPMHVLRAAHYTRQAAIGLQHAHEAGLVHRDIKPGNVLVDRAGTVKVLDMGLARFFHDEEDILTKKYDESVLGTADYLAPEQALDSHGVDIRADIYSLGATFYFCLTGQPPFNEGTVAQKLIWHQTRQPKPVRTVRPEVPEQLAAIIGKMMEKDKAKRYQTPAQVAEALAPLTTRPIPPPPESEMPRLSPAAMSPAAVEATVNAPTPAPVPQMVRPTMPGVTAPVARIVSPQQVAAMPQQAARSQANVPTPDPRRVATPPPRPQQPAAAPPRPPSGINGGPAEPAPNWGEMNAGRPVGARPPSATRQPGPSAFQKVLAEVKRRPRLWAILVGGVLLAFLLLIVALKFTVGGKGKSTPPAPSRRLNVSRTGDFRTIQDALAKAVSGDRIVLKDEIHEEQLEIRLDRSVKDIAIEGDPNLGKPVVWRPPPASRAGPLLKQLITIASCDGLTLKGFILSGQNGPIQTQDAVTIFSRCPGLTLEDLRIENFNGSAVKLINANGDAGRPIVLRNLRTAPPLKPDGLALLVDVQENYKPPMMDNVLVENCRFDGPFQAAVRIAVDPQCKKAALEFRGNRVFGNKVGRGAIVAKGPKGRGPLQLTLASNTFYNLQGGLFLDVLPVMDDKQPSRVVLQDNLFITVPLLAQLKEDPALVKTHAPKEVPAQWIWFNEGDPVKNAAVGNVFFRSPSFNMPKDFTNATVNVTADDAFTVYVNGREDKALGGENGKHIHAFDVTTLLQPQGNMIAVHGRNHLGPAGLILQLTCNVPGNPVSQTVIFTNDKWKANKENPGGWHKPGFAENDKWQPVKVLGAYGQIFGNNLIWDSVVHEQFAPLVQKLVPPDTGTVCNTGCRDGNVPLRARVMEIKDLNLDSNSEQFLRYPKNSPLATAGIDKKPVGAPPVD